VSSALFILVFGVVLPALAGLWAGRLAGLCRIPRWPSFAAGALAGTALLIVLPDVWSQAAWLAAGFAGIALVDRFVHPLCGACRGADSSWSLWPLWLALGTHSLLDGALLQMAHPGSAASWILLGHRVPEVLATVALLRAAQPGNGGVGGPVAALQSLVAVGALCAPALPRELVWQTYAFAGGAVLFLALHRLHRIWRESTLCWSTSLAGVAGVGVVQLGLRFLGKH
jgi:hypothetical protein